MGSGGDIAGSRLLVYMVRIWQKHLEQHPDAQRLPAIVPLVVHHSAHGWRAPRVFAELIDLDDEARAVVADYIPSFRYELDEISVASDAELVGRSLTALGLMTLVCLGRAHTTDDLVSELERFTDRLQQVLNAPNGVAALAAILSYVSEVTDSPLERLQHLVQRLGPRGEEAYMTAAQILREEGANKAAQRVARMCWSSCWS